MNCRCWIAGLDGRASMALVGVGESCLLTELVGVEEVGRMIVVLMVTVVAVEFLDRSYRGYQFWEGGGEGSPR